MELDQPDGWNLLDAAEPRRRVLIRAAASRNNIASDARKMGIFNYLRVLLTVYWKLITVP